MTRRTPATAALVVAVVLVALTLRANVASLAPVLPDVRADLALGSAAAGVLTALPVLCFGLFAPVVPLLTRRWGTDHVLLGALAVLALAVGARPWAGAWLLLAGTLLVGLTCTVGNVLLPVVVRRDAAEHVATMTGVGAATLAAGAALTAATTAPLADRTGWRGALACWAVLAVVAAAVWRRIVPVRSAPPRARAEGALWRDPLVWWLALFMGTQSALFYAVTAWLPTLLRDEAGLTPNAAGGALAVFQVVGVAGALAAPALSRGRPSQVGPCATTAVVWAASVLGLLLAPRAWVAWCVTGGLAQGAGIGLALLLVALRAGDAAAVPRLSGVVQGAGYVLGAAGPVVVGVVSAARGWSAALWLLVATAVVMALAATRAGAARTVRTAQAGTKVEA